MKIKYTAILIFLALPFFLKPAFAYLPTYYEQTPEFIAYIDSVRIWLIPVFYTVISIEAFIFLSLCEWVQKEIISFRKKNIVLGTVLLLNFFLYGDSYTREYSGYFSKLRGEAPNFLEMVDFRGGLIITWLFLGFLLGSFAIGFLLSRILVTRIFFKNPKISTVFLFTVFLSLFLFSYFGGIITETLLLRILEIVYPFNGQRYFS